VLVADDGGDPSTYAAEIKDMVENQHVVAFVGNGAVLSAAGGRSYHRASGVPVLWVAADAATLSRVAQSCTRQGCRPQYMAITIRVSGDTSTVDGLQNIIVGADVFPFTGAHSPAIDQYEQARRTYAADVLPDSGYAIAWTGAKLFELVVTRAARATGEITPASLRSALLTVKGETLGGPTAPLTYTSKGALGIKDCYFGLQGDGKGGFTAVYGAAAQCVR
jgi:ABC-type branched-subunit amino acid transport system substrate-binding protein